MRRRPIREVLTAAALGAALSSGAAAPAWAVAPGAAPARPDFDARSGDRAAIPAATGAARTTLAKGLGPLAAVTADPVTGGLRSVGRTDGFLTQPSDADPAAIALGYVRDHADAFGLDPGDLAALQLVDRSTSPDGITHLAFGQLDGGVPAYDSALTAAVTADGRLLSAGGAPVHDLAAPSTDPPLGPGAARAAAQRDVGATVDGAPGTIGGDPARTTTFPDGDRASLVTLADPGGDHLAWKLTVAGPAPASYEVLVDAATGAVLTRHSLTDFLSSNARVHKLHPGDGTLGLQAIGPWLAMPVTGLSGPNVHAYPDRRAPDGLDTNGDADVAPSSGNDFVFTTTSTTAGGGQHCPSAYTTACTWNGTNILGGAATTNLPAAVTQAFFLTNAFHDWLAAAPIGFDAGSHNFQGADRLDAEVDDYSGTNNANMTTPADGASPTMQMYLFNAPYPAVNGADDATVVLHEYTHGLTNRLVGGDGMANGLVARQSQAMGEGWSDWYALDFLTANGQIVDTPAPGDELIGAYVTDDTATGIRENAIDCPVGAPATSPLHCPGTPTAGGGGFTFGDLGRIDAYDGAHTAFEVHADGEIWAETLWDLRQALGAATARALITSGLRLMPKQPSFLDARDAILAADTAAGGTRRTAIWTVFARRGMGYGATTSSNNATHAVEAFDTPPVAAPGAPSAASVALEQDTPITIPVANPGTAPLTHVRASLGAPSSGVAITSGSADLGTIAPGAQADAALALRVAATAGCGSVATATLTIASDQGTQSFPVSLPVGSGRSGTFTRSYAPPATIADDAPTGGVTSTLHVDGGGRVGPLRVTLAAAHTWIGDLHATLTSPSGTTVDLMERPGVDAGGYFSRANLVTASPLTFDDGAEHSIQTIANSEMTISGPWQPNEPLARFAGEPRAGDWTLRVTDVADGAAGTLTSWSLQTADPACAITDAPTGLDGDAATFHARLDPGSAAGTTAAFELGTTTAYGARSPAAAVTAGGGLRDYAVSTGGLTPGTTYHVRAVLLRDGVVVTAGADRTFVAGSQSGRGGTDDTTPGDDGGAGGGDAGGIDPGTGGGDGAVQPGASGGAGTGAADGAGTPLFQLPKATMKGMPRTVRLDRRGRYALAFRATPPNARGRIRLAAGRMAAGSKAFTVPSSGRVKITVKATKKLVAALRRKRSVKVKATLRIGITPFTATLTIKPPKTAATARR